MTNNNNDLFDDVIAVIRKKANEMGKDFAQYFNDFQKAIDGFGGWEGLLSYAMYAEEKKCDTITFEECVSWVKSNLKSELHSGAIISKMKNTQTFGDDTAKMTLKICFMDKNGKPLPDETSKHLIIRCNSFDGDLKNYFGDKDTIVLK